MVIDFRNLNFSERPTLILRNMDLIPFGVLGKAFNIKANLKFNEVSELTFDYPAQDNGELTPFFDDIKAMNIIDLKDCGQFILKSADIKTDGIRKIKSCTAYSLEFEMTYKQFFAEKGTYNLWNPVAPNGTIIGMILQDMPYWSVGRVDTSLIGRYRTFEASSVNIYNFVKNTAQQTYGCIFTFDTYRRTINVVNVASIIPAAPVYLSLDNLIKDIDIKEDTEDILTCLEAFGADDVDIRSVNPIGSNKIYNLDYFMTESNLSKAIIAKWAVWKKLFADRQLPYYNIMIEESIQSARLLTEQTVLTDMNGDLKKLEHLQSVSVQYLGSHPHDANEQEKLEKINSDIRAQQSVIVNQESLIESIKQDMAPIVAQKKAINKELAFETTFSRAEILSFSKYIKEDSIQDSTFVVSQVKDYNTADISGKHQNALFAVTNSAVTRIANQNKALYNIVGGSLSCPCGESQLTAEVVRGTLERKQDGAFIFTAYLNHGQVGDSIFPSGNISATGSAGAVNSDVVPDADVPGAYENGTRLSYTASDARVYFTQNATEYEARAVQFELYDYAKSCLDKVSVPTYSFSLNAANFLSLEDFVSFKNNFTLGQRVYLEIADREVLTPVVLGVSIDFESLTDFSLEFSDRFTTKDVAFLLVDMLKESVSMGKKFSADRYINSAFTNSGANTSLDTVINSALDFAKNAILSSTGQAISLDENGLRFRQWNADRTGYEPEQMWGNNNTLALTDDNWATVKTAIGKIAWGNGTLYGLVGEALIGNIFVRQKLIFERPNANLNSNNY